MKIGEYKKACENHNWHYMHNSGTKSYLKSKAKEKQLEAIAEEKGGEYKQLFDQKIKEREMHSAYSD